MKTIIRLLKKFIPIMLLLAAFSFTVTHADVTQVWWKKIGANDIWTTGTASPQGQAIIHIGGCILEPSHAPCTAGSGVGTVTASAPLSSSGGVAPNISLTGIVSVPHGGSGASSLTGVLFGNGAAPFTATALPGSPTEFLNGNGTFSVPAGGSATPAAPDRSIQINNAGAFGSQRWAIDLGDNLLGDTGTASGSGSISFGQGAGTVATNSNTSLAFGNSGGGNIRANSNDSLVHGSVDANPSSLIQTGSTASQAFGNATSAGSISTGGVGSFAFGVADNGQIQTNDDGSLAMGEAASTANIATTGVGSIAAGYANDTGIAGNSYINTGGAGSLAMGSATSGGNIQSSLGSIVFGTSGGDDGVSLASRLFTDASGSLVHGSVTGGSNITVNANGSHAFGFTQVGSIIINGTGAQAFGTIDSGDSSSEIIADSTASQAFGYVSALTGGLLRTEATGSQAHGRIVGSGGIIQTSGEGATSFGYSSGGHISASGIASQAFGIVDANNSSVITPSGNGSLAFGSVANGGSINTTSNGSQSFGVSSGGSITNNQQAALAFGSVDSNPTSTIYANADATLVYGVALNGANITASHVGGYAGGYVNGPDGLGNQSQILSDGLGSFAHGEADGGGIVSATGQASFAIGTASGSDGAGLLSTIHASNGGSYAHGDAENGGLILASAHGSTAFGFSSGSGSQIWAQGDGATVFGNVQAGGHIKADSAGAFAGGSVINAGNQVAALNTSAFAFGNDSVGSLVAGGNNSVAFGSGFTNGTADSFMVGYGNPQLTVNGNGEVDINSLSTHPIKLTSNASIDLAIPAGWPLNINTQPGVSGQVLTSQGGANPPIWANAPGTGAVTAVSVVNTHGFSGSSSGGTTPALTLNTTITGLLRGDGTSLLSTAIGSGLNLSGGGTLSNTGLLAPAGSSTQIQFNNAGSLGASTNLVWDFTNSNLLLDGSTASAGTNSFVWSGSGVSTSNASNSFTIGKSFTNSNADSFEVAMNGSIELKVLTTGVAQFVNGSAFMGTNNTSGQLTIFAPSGLFVGGALPTANGQIITEDTTGGPSWSSAIPHVASADLTGQTAAVASVATVTPASTHQYRVGGYITVTAISVNTISLQVTYTDETSTLRTQSFFPQGLTSAAIATTGAFDFPPMDIRATSGSAITVKTVTVGAGSQTYDVGATIQQID